MIAAGGSAAALIELGAVLLLLAVLGRGAARIGLPSIPLYLLAGLAMGQGGLVPLDASDDFIRVGADVGVVLLLLLLGLEYTGTELRDGLRANWRGGLVDLLLGLAPGAAAGALLGWDVTACVAMAGVTYVSSSGIIAKLVDDLGRLGRPETPVIMSILVMEDLAMAVFLPVLGVLLAGVLWWKGMITVAVAMAAVMLILVVSIRYGHQVSALVAAKSRELLLLTLLGLTFLVAGIAEKVQVSSAVGAFLIGVALSGGVAHTGRQLLMPLRDVFGGLFFVFFGLQIDPGSLPPVLLAAAALGVVSAATKAFAGWWAAGRSGLDRTSRRRAGLTLVPRGEFSIVIGGLAVAAGAEPDIGALTAAYVLMMAIGGSLLARFA